MGALAVAGVLTNSVLLLTAHYAMVHVGAAQIALVQTLNPLLTALLAWPLLGERLRPLQWLGLVLGAAGVVLIVGLAAAGSPLELHGLLLTASGVVGLCGGTLYFGRFCRGVPILEGTTVQLLAAAAACVAATALFETPHAIGRRVRSPPPYGTRRRCRWAGWRFTMLCWRAARWRERPRTSIWCRAPRR